jgi:hypothetical protein
MFETNRFFFVFKFIVNTRHGGVRCTWSPYGIWKKCFNKFSGVSAEGHKKTKHSNSDFRRACRTKYIRCTCNAMILSTRARAFGFHGKILKKKQKKIRHHYCITRFGYYNISLENDFPLNLVRPSSFPRKEVKNIRLVIRYNFPAFLACTNVNSTCNQLYFLRG